MGNILILTYFSFKDALVQTYTLPYVRIIRGIVKPERRIFLFTIEKKTAAFTPEEKRKKKEELKKEGIEWITMTYDRFGWKVLLRWVYTLIVLWVRVLRDGISIIHCWATASGAAGYLLSITTGTPLIIDSYEPHAEAMVENRTWSKNSLAYNLLFRLERLQSKRAQVIIAATNGMRTYALEKYGATFDRFFVKPACVDLQLFSKANLKKKSLLHELGLEGKLVCVYAGKFGGIYQEQEVFDFFKVASDHWGEKFRVLLLTDQSRDSIVAYCQRSKINAELVIQKFVPHNEVPDYMGLGDFGITPVKPAPSKRYCSPIKDGEYWALGLPVVIPANISDDAEIIEENNVGAILRGFSEGNYREAILKIDELLSQPRDLNFDKIRMIAEKYRSFEIARQVYLAIYQDVE